LVANVLSYNGQRCAARMSQRYRTATTSIGNRRGLCASMARVIVGDVNAAGLAKTRMAKSVLDAGWSMFREQLRYKALRHGVAFEFVSEKWTTQTCSDCASIGGPKGIAGLGMRHWTLF